MARRFHPRAIYANFTARLSLSNYRVTRAPCAGTGSRRCGRVQKLINDTTKLALKKKVKVRRFSRAEIKRAFSESGARNKYEIAVAIARRFPELQPRLPRCRKPWMSEDYRMSIFDAVAFALTLLGSIPNAKGDVKYAYRTEVEIYSNPSAGVAKKAEGNAVSDDVDK